MPFSSFLQCLFDLFAGRAHACISELPYHSNKPPGRHPHPTKANNR
ncbi:hypothetical protein NEIMUCOT_03550 [Neisseria mucosa ATCC 25996]|uniref:Uncharacterized protein n=1 Tax=Neisseria mucosa (strain ATCC 25996 / DSM 4631 / NCTC 10774 / M26) TaxID=546266 RepID=D2ZSG7_NEIM2|nr:hypothetical protein NEIMUCOT_03550 [Neisseria mucosa ATCC 25996]